MGVPHDVKREHVLKAIQEVQSGRVQIPQRRLGRRYVVRHDGFQFPAKFLICRAHAHVDGKEWPNVFHGGAEANNFLIARKFEIYNLDTRERVGVEPEIEDEESTFAEGRAKYQLHRSLERDAKISRLAKQRRLRSMRQLACDVCGFNVEARYGPLGVGYIEAHHTIPVCQLKGKRKTKLEEIALVCSNCHRMLHKARPWLSISQLQSELKP